MNRLTIRAIATVLIALPAAAMAQSRGNAGVPPGHKPPAGMCRVWIDGVPPGHQPGATDCATAMATVPRNGRVIWGQGTSRDRVFSSGGEVIVPGGQTNCVRRTDSRGVVRVFCDPRQSRTTASRTYITRGDDQVRSLDRDEDRRAAKHEAKHEKKHGKKHGKGDRHLARRLEHDGPVGLRPRGFVFSFLT